MRFLFNAVLTFFALSSVSISQTIYVPQDHGTIQAAVNAAETDARIVVAPGTYDEPRIEIDGKSLTIEGAPGLTLISPSALGGALIFRGGGTYSLVLKGLVFRDSMGPESAVVIEDARVDCLNCSFLSNNSLVAGAAVSLAAQEHAVYSTFQRCKFRYNFSSSTGGAINMTSPPNGPTTDVILSSCVFAENISAVGASCISGAVGGHATFAIQNCTLWYNFALASVGSEGTVHVIGDIGSTISMTGVNTIARQNTPAQFMSTNNSLPNSTISVQSTHCNLDAFQAGSYNMNVDTAFADPLNGDFSLDAGSLCIDAGVWYFPVCSTDIQNESRVQGFAYDVGADEFHPVERLEGSNEGLDADVSIYPFSAYAYPEVSAGDYIRFQAYGTTPPFDTSPIAIVAQTYVPGGRPESPFGFPEAHINPDLANPPHVLIDSGDLNSFPVIPGGAVSIYREIPVGFSGFSFTVQAFSLSLLANNGFFAASPAFEVQVH